MTVTIIGRQVVSYKSRQTGQLKEGISLYYTSKKQGVTGLFSGNLWISKGSELYDRWEAFDLAFPVQADATFEMQPGSRFPYLIDVEIFKDAG